MSLKRAFASARLRNSRLSPFDTTTPSVTYRIGPDTSYFARLPGADVKFTVTIVLPISIPFSNIPVVTMVRLSDDPVCPTTDPPAPRARARASIADGNRLTVHSFLAGTRRL